MARIAVISDIHANPFALEAVVDDIRRVEVDEVVVGGDLVGRGPLGSQVVDAIRQLGWPSVRGNHEDYTLEFRQRSVPQQWLTDSRWAASRWMADELDDDHAAYIDTLPFTMTASRAPGLRIYHASPRSYREGIGEWTAAETLQTHFDAIDEPVLVCAHTHRPLVREVGDGLIVNVGSVGLPFNGDWRAQYCIFTETADGWDIDFRRVDYDRQAFLKAYETSGFLAHGDVSAHLLKKEVERARPYLVPFLTWADETDHPAVMESLEAFFEVYDANMSMGEFYALLAE